MSRMTADHLKTGMIFGDVTTQEYIYLPASEIGLTDPMCVLETPAGRQDVPFSEAVRLVTKLSLKPVCHPLLGRTSC